MGIAALQQTLEYVAEELAEVEESFENEETDVANEQLEAIPVATKATYSTRVRILAVALLVLCDAALCGIVLGVGAALSALGVQTSATKPACQIACGCITLLCIALMVISQVKHATPSETIAADEIKVQPSAQLSAAMEV